MFVTLLILLLHQGEVVSYKEHEEGLVVRVEVSE